MHRGGDLSSRIGRSHAAKICPRVWGGGVVSESTKDKDFVSLFGSQSRKRKERTKKKLRGGPSRQRGSPWWNLAAGKCTNGQARQRGRRVGRLSETTRLTHVWMCKVGEEEEEEEDEEIKEKRRQGPCGSHKSIPAILGNPCEYQRETHNGVCPSVCPSVCLSVCAYLVYVAFKRMVGNH